MLMAAVLDLRDGVGTDEDRVRAIDRGALHRDSSQPKQHEHGCQAKQYPQIVTRKLQHGNTATRRSPRSFRKIITTQV